MNPEATIEIRETEHLFYRLDLFQDALVDHAAQQQRVWKSNVRAMTKQWLDMGLRPRAVTRDLSWGISVPMEGDEWTGKCIYVWFEAVQGYSTCARIWASDHASKHPQGTDAWKRWWTVDESGAKPRHLYFLGKDNIPFHTVIWPALILGLNQVHKGASASDPIALPGPGEFALESNVPAMEYLMLAGGQFSKSRKHAVWLPSFLDRYDPDTLRYYLSMNMPENHDTDFNWPDFVEKVNSELIAAYGNFVHRMLTLGARLPGADNGSPFKDHDHHLCCKPHQVHLGRSLGCHHHFVETPPLQGSTPRRHERGSIRESNPPISRPMEASKGTSRWPRRKPRNPRILLACFSVPCHHGSTVPTIQLTTPLEVLGSRR